VRLVRSLFEHRLGVIFASTPLLYPTQKEAPLYWCSVFKETLQKKLSIHFALLSARWLAKATL
jgi:hypothetical protein